MNLDTEIEGSPSSIRLTGHWLKDDLATVLDRGADALVVAARVAEGDWNGLAGEAFAGTARGLVEPVDDGRQEVLSAGEALLSYADSLERAQTRMAHQRDRARGAGLVVVGFVIEAPGAGPVRPGDLSMPASEGQVLAYNRDVELYNQHQDLIEAFNEIAARVQEIREDAMTTVQRIWAEDRRLSGTQWALLLADAFSEIPKGMLKTHLSGIQTRAAVWHADAVRSFDDLLATEKVSAKYHQDYYDSVERSRANVASAADDLAAAKRLSTLPKLMGQGLGGAFFVGGIVYDMTREGEAKEGLTQAVASNGGSMVASMATGAIIGTAIGGPVGTVAGVLVGAGMGIFTSGMIDGLWKYDGDISDATLAGVDAVRDATGQLLTGASDLGGAVVDGIGGWFD